MLALLHRVQILYSADTTNSFSMFVGNCSFLQTIIYNVHMKSTLTFLWWYVDGYVRNTDASNFKRIRERQSWVFFIPLQLKATRENVSTGRLDNTNSVLLQLKRRKRREKDRCVKVGYIIKT